MSDTIEVPLLSPRQRAAATARQAFAAKFASDDERRAHFRSLAQRSGRQRLVLTGEERQAIAAAYDLLGKIAVRARVHADAPPSSEPA